MSETFYNVLGLNKKASKDEIKKAYRSLQMKFHPDKNLGNSEAIGMTQKINEAYETLGDEQKREEYDQMRTNPFMRMNSYGPHNMDSQADDIFKMFFGGGMPPGMSFGGMPFGGGMPPGAKIHIVHGGPMGFQQAMQKPIPIIQNVSINMEQVLNGATIPIDIERWILENGNKVFEHETIYIPIPQGIDDGEITILRDKGNIINENLKGDVKLIIKIVNDTIFKRSGLDLILEKNIPLKDALCGFSFDITYLNGKSYTLNNNKGNIIPPEYRKMYPGMGLTRGEHKGNLVIHFHLDFPEKLTDEQIGQLLLVL